MTDVATGTTGRGALGRSLPLQSDGWRLQLPSVSAKRRVSVVTVTHIDGLPITPKQARRALRIVRGLATNPGAYAALVPMSALQGTHHEEDPR